MHELVEVENRQQDSKHDKEYSGAHEQNHDRFEYGHQARDEAREFAFLIDGGPVQHFAQGAGLFTAGNQVDGHRRKEFALCQCPIDCAPFAYPVGGLGHGLVHGNVADYIAGDAHGIEYRYAATDKDGKRAGEACSVEAAHQAADERGIEQPGVKAPAWAGSLQRPVHSDDQGEQTEQDQPPPVAQSLRDSDQDAREQRQLMMDVYEHLGHLRYYISHESDHDGGSNHRQQNRIN